MFTKLCINFLVVDLNRPNSHNLTIQDGYLEQGIFIVVKFIELYFGNSQQFCSQLIIRTKGARARGFKIKIKILAL